MQRIELTVDVHRENGDNIDIQNGNMYFLRELYGLPFRNENGNIIHLASISMVQNNPRYFINANHNTTNPVLVDISVNLLDETLRSLTVFKSQLPDINFNESIHEEQNVIDDRELDRRSLEYAITSIWSSFSSDMIYEVLDNDIMDIIHHHPYVNVAYDEYMIQYMEEMEDEDEDERLRYIHPLLFPKIFELVFTNNQIPKTPLERLISVDGYNDEITKHNLQYLHDDRTNLYIYRRFSDMSSIINKLHNTKKLNRENLNRKNLNLKNLEKIISRLRAQKRSKSGRIRDYKHRRPILVY